MARELALAAGLLTAALWLLWTTVGGGGWRGELATAGLWWLAAAQATWRVWAPAAVVLGALWVAVREADGREAGSPVRLPRRASGSFPRPVAPGFPRSPLPFPTEWEGGRGGSSGTQGAPGRGEGPHSDDRTGTQPPTAVSGGGPVAGEPRPRALPVRPVTAAPGPVAVGPTPRAQRSQRVKQLGGGWEARRAAQREQIVAAFRALGADAADGYVDKAAVAAATGLDRKTVDNRCAELGPKGARQLENPAPGQWRAPVALPAEADSAPVAVEATA